MATLSDMFAAGLQQIDTRRCALPVQAPPHPPEKGPLTYVRCRGARFVAIGYLGYQASPLLKAAPSHARLAALNHIQLTLPAASVKCPRPALLAGQTICSWSWIGGR